MSVLFFKEFLLCLFKGLRVQISDLLSSDIRFASRIYPMFATLEVGRLLAGSYSGGFRLRLLVEKITGSRCDALMGRKYHCKVYGDKSKFLVKI